MDRMPPRSMSRPTDTMRCAFMISKPDRTVHWIGSGIIAVILVCLAPLRSASAAASGAVTAPSDEYRVQIDGREIPTEAFRDVNLATFSFSAPVEVAIR